MALRNDLSKVEKTEALKICKDIVENYREDLSNPINNTKNTAHGAGGVFDKLDLSVAEKELAKDTKKDNDPKQNMQLQ